MDEYLKEYRYSARYRFSAPIGLTALVIVGIWGLLQTRYPLSPYQKILFLTGSIVAAYEAAVEFLRGSEKISINDESILCRGLFKVTKIKWNEVSKLYYIPTIGKQGIELRTEDKRKIVINRNINNFFLLYEDIPKKTNVPLEPKKLWGNKWK